jgi:endonuclease G
MKAPEKQLREARHRWEARNAERQANEHKIDAFKHGRARLVDIDEPQRVALRSQRIFSNPIVAEALATTVGAPPETSGGSRVELLERIIGGNNLLGVAFLEIGVTVANTVGRIHAASQFQDLGFGTGFLVSPRLLLTNNHVLSSPSVARFSTVEFLFQNGIDGKPLTSHTFELQPDVFFLTDEELDFTLVAVAGQSRTNAPTAERVPLSRFGFNRLSAQQGKVLIGEHINIIQHPSGKPKHVALQQNEMIDRLGDFLHYRTDTAPGSSGSPLYNNQWEVIGLHHSGVPRRGPNGEILALNGQPWTEDMGDDQVAWIANEGIRTSSILTRAAAAAAALGGEQGGILADVLNPPAIAEVRDALTPGRGGLPLDTVATDSQAGPASVAAPIQAVTRTTSGGVTLTIPLQITVSLGAAPAGSVASAVQPQPADVPIATELTPKKPIIDKVFSNRRGFNTEFLGPGPLATPLPAVLDLDSVAKLNGSTSHVIPYQHFSVVMHKARRLALFTAANVDGRPGPRKPDPTKSYTRDALGGFGPNDLEEWVTDARIPADAQLPDVFFSKDRKAFDKGHIVRRDDVCWGATFADLQRANGDTYHTTNCSPQVKGYNQSTEGINNWGDLENLVLQQAKTEQYCLFAGPILKSNDRKFRGVDEVGQVFVKIPRSYWKVVVAAKNGRLQSFAFVLAQDLSGVAFEVLALEAEMVTDPRALEFKPTPEWKRFMLPIAKLEKRLGSIRFPAAIHDADQFSQAPGQEIASVMRLELEP